MHTVNEATRADNKDDPQRDIAAFRGKNEYHTVDKEAEEETGNATYDNLVNFLEFFLIKKSTKSDGSNCANKKAKNSFENVHSSSLIICLKDREDTDVRKCKGKKQEKAKSVKKNV